MIKAVVFDLWGTLAYSRGPSLAKTVKDWQMVDLPEDEIGRQLARARMCHSVKNLRKGLGEALKLLKIKPREDLLVALENDWRKAAELARPYSETISLLPVLGKQYKIGLVSNCSFFSYSRFTKRYDLEKFFDVLALSFKVGVLKPDKEIFKYAVKGLGLNFQEILYVGDSPRDDIQPARKLGMKAVLIDRVGKYQKRKSIKNLNEIRRILKG